MEDYTGYYSIYNLYGNPNISFNTTLQKGQYAIAACWNGGRISVAPTVNNCTEIGRTYSSYGSLTSTNDGGIAYLVIYKANIDGATISYNASWANCGVIILN